MPNFTRKEIAELKKIAKNKIEVHNPSKDALEVEDPKKTKEWQYLSWFIGAILVIFLAMAIPFMIKYDCFFYYSDGYCMTNKQCFIAYAYTGIICLFILHCIFRLLKPILKRLKNRI